LDTHSGAIVEGIVECHPNKISYRNEITPSPQCENFDADFFLLILCGLLVVDLSQALGRRIIVGANTIGARYMNDEQQDALIEQLRENGVKTVRTGIGDRFNRFIVGAPSTWRWRRGHCIRCEANSRARWTAPARYPRPLTIRHPVCAASENSTSH
jgi:hypothetical protein